MRSHLNTIPVIKWNWLFPKRKKKERAQWFEWSEYFHNEYFQLWICSFPMRTQYNKNNIPNIVSDSKEHKHN